LLTQSKDFSHALGFPRKTTLVRGAARFVFATETAVVQIVPSFARERRPAEFYQQRVVEVAQDANVAVKTLPGLYELISGDADLARAAEKLFPAEAGDDADPAP